MADKEAPKVDQPMSEPVKAFRLKAEKRHTQAGKSLKPGDVVDLTERQATAFRDKFDAVDGSEFKPKPLQVVKTTTVETVATVATPAPGTNPSNT